MTRDDRTIVLLNSDFPQLDQRLAGSFSVLRCAIDYQ